jgi:hypothetical protein
MKRVLLAASLIVLVLGGVAFWHLNRPKVKINRAVDRLFETLGHKKVSLTAPTDPREALRDVLAAEIRIIGIPEVDSPVVTFEQFCEKVDTLHRLTSLCEFQEQDRRVIIEGHQAQASRTTTITAAAGPRFRMEQTRDLIFDLEKSDRWRITAIRARKED